MRVLQWNMGFPRAKQAAPPDASVVARREQLLEALLKEHEPSVVALQEALPDADSFFTRQGYGSQTHEGLTTAYLNGDWVPPGPPFLDYSRALGILLVSLSGSVRVRVCNLHLPSWLSGSDAVRRRELKRIVSELDGVREREIKPASEIVLGDFNLVGRLSESLPIGTAWRTLAPPSHATHVTKA